MSIRASITAEQKEKVWSLSRSQIKIFWEQGSPPLRLPHHSNKTVTGTYPRTVRVSPGWNENHAPAQGGRAWGQQLVEDMAIIYKNMLSQAHKNKSPKLNSWEGLGVAPRLASSLPDGEVRPRLARQLHLNFRFPLGPEKIAGEGKRKKSNEHDCSVFSPRLIK